MKPEIIDARESQSVAATRPRAESQTMSRHLVKMWFLTEHLESGKHFVTPRTTDFSFCERSHGETTGNEVEKVQGLFIISLNSFFEVFDKGFLKALKFKVLEKQQGFLPPGGQLL